MRAGVRGARHRKGRFGLRRADVAASGRLGDGQRSAFTAVGAASVPRFLLPRTPAVAGGHGGHVRGYEHHERYTRGKPGFTQEGGWRGGDAAGRFLHLRRRPAGC